MGTQEKITLALEPRTAMKKKVRALRREGILPGAICGKGLETMLIQVGKKDFDLVYRKTHGTAIIDGSLKGKKLPLLIHEIRRNTISGEIIHVDFLKVDMKSDITVEIPLMFMGVSPAEKEGKGKIGHEATSILIKCPAAHIPQGIEVDVSVIADKHDVIHAKDLKLPEGASLGHGVSPEKVIAHLSQAKLAETTTAVEAEAEATAPEAAE